MWHDILTKFHEDKNRRSSNIKILHKKIWNAVILVLLKWIFMKCAVEKSSGSMIYILSVIKIDSSIKKLLGGYIYIHTDNNVTS